jgi:annexin A7/11
MAASQDAKPSIIKWNHFDAEADAKALRSAMKGIGTDEKAVIKVVCKRNHHQLKEIEKVYQQLFGRVLQDDLKSELSGKFETVITSLFYTDAEYCALVLHNATSGAGTDEDAIIEILCTRNNNEISDIKDAYKKKYNKDLMKTLVDDTSGDFKRFLVSLTSADREVSDVDEKKAAHEAKGLFEAGQKRAGTDEETFNMIFARRSFRQLRATFHDYEKLYKKSILKVINDEFGGNIMLALNAVAVTALEHREAYFAEQLHASMKGAGTRDDKLIRLIVNRSNNDLETVKIRFMEKYKKTLESWINDDCSGDYKDALLALVKGNHEQ